MGGSVVVLAAAGLLAIVIPAAAILGGFAGAASTPSGTPGSAATQAAAGPSPSVIVTPPTTPPATATPTATPIPLVPAPLTGRLVTEAEARYHPIAVMIDDHSEARPQAGFNAASVVWHAPAEGGIARYMLIFQDRIPTEVGPIRSTRQYYVEWAAETTAMLVHHGGSPEAQATLARYGDGDWVFNADGMRWEPRYVWRVDVDGRFAPHNVFTDGENLRLLAERVGAVDGPIDQAWQFEPEAPFAVRAKAGTIRVVYPFETVTYRYDPHGNRYLRYLNGAKEAQKDAADGGWVAPKNVVILRMRLSAIPGDRFLRLDARNVGSGEAWIATNGVTVKGTWRKASETAPTLLFGPDGEAITLTVGQTFVQVLALSYDFEIKDGAPSAGLTMPAIPAP
jgi:hypothetical protein